MSTERPDDVTAPEATEGLRGVSDTPWDDRLTRGSLLKKGAALAVGSGILAGGVQAAPGRVRQGAKGTLLVAMHGDMQNLDPNTQAFDLLTAEMLVNLYALPIRFKTPGFIRNGVPYAHANQFLGDAAESWTWNKDRTEVTFIIRPNLKFPDGSPLDAGAVKASLDRMFDVKGVGIYLYDMTGLKSKDGIQALDSRRIKFTLPASSSLLFGNMTETYSSALFNMNIVKQHATQDDPGAQQWLKTNVAGSGPYVLKEWNVGSGWTLEANPEYWFPVRTKNVTFQIIPDAQQRELLLRSGRVDMASAIPVKDVPRLQQDPNLTVISVPSRNIGYAGFDVTAKPFDNKLVRQALSYAVPYQTIVDQVLRGQGLQLKSPVAAGTPGSNFSYWKYHTNYDRAKELLSKAGYPRGFDIELAVPVGNPLDAETALWIQQGFQKIGVDVSITKMPLAAWTTRLVSGKHKFWYSSYAWIGINNDPLYAVYWLFANDCCHYGHYNNRQVAKLVFDSVNKPASDPKRKAVVNEVQRRIVEDAPWIFVMQPPSVYAMRKNVKGFVYYTAEGFLRYKDLYKV